ncbi:Fe2+-enterobactin ABC transporter substrate-binding protein [Brenneria tiliae]|uniref:Fe2+-enterobactin ABC transporter substrate-binding protein n=1 Tax=Brenneria tiliae TaxID=2914984 RepID=A0ABT0MX83_9GAMM|nr:Fe2+-enterobactin ABC transporter substrate-binding protein [Brenneria tiliae]MCL2894372.1 Fe2+-enterobactin ABC transporter substrate-binding protein [Brenneria tiliae]
MNGRKGMAGIGRLITALALTAGLIAQGVSPPAAAAQPGWPREFRNADGTATTLTAPPRRILSTSVTITGTLLAVDAPVAASATAANGRFFAQWDKAAQARGVEKLWPAGSVDLEAAYAVAPDLIVVAATGGDSALGQIGELQAIAPTIVLDYGGQTWQDLARQIGAATGLEAQINARIVEFDAAVAAARDRITPPAGKVNIISYNGPGTSNPIATADGVHARLLQSLGFTLEAPDPAWQSSVAPRQDFVWTEYENLTRLSASTTFLLNAGDDKAAAFLADPLLANLPSVKKRQVYGLGVNSFRIDYFSAGEIIAGIVRRFGKAEQAAPSP